MKYLTFGYVRSIKFHEFTKHTLSANFQPSKFSNACLYFVFHIFLSFQKICAMKSHECLEQLTNSLIDSLVSRDSLTFLKSQDIASVKIYLNLSHSLSPSDIDFD